jgi:hypothetical protein
MFADEPEDVPVSTAPKAVVEANIGAHVEAGRLLIVKGAKHFFAGDFALWGKGDTSDCGDDVADIGRSPHVFDEPGPFRVIFQAG